MSVPKTAKISLAALLLAVAVGGGFYLNRSESSASSQSTDDAYVQADFTTVSPRVGGTLMQVLVKENQVVQAGALLAVIDDRDYVVALDAARAQVVSAQASVARLQSQKASQRTAIRQAQAGVAAGDATLKLAQTNKARYRNLAADGSGTVQALQQAEAQLSIQTAGLDKDRAGLLASRQQVDILDADMEKAKAAVAMAEAAQAAAQLKLSYTQITAPVSGTVGQNGLRIGDSVAVGKPLLTIVPLDAIYIAANFRETQLARIQTGQAVDIRVDALPGKVFRGTVESLGPASGVTYSAVAPHNATGNFTKIVQRLPVRVHIEPDQAGAQPLRVGMSATAEVRIPHVADSRHAAATLP